MSTVFVVAAIIRTSDGAELTLSQAFESREQALGVYYRFSQEASQAKASSVEIHELAVIPKCEN